MIYEYHCCFNCLLCTIGFVTRIAADSPAIVSTSWILLKDSLSRSNVPDGDILVKKRSWPCAKTRDVDSSSAGELRIVFAP